MTQPGSVRQSIVIRTVSPQIDGGRYPVKRVIGEVVEVQAEIFTHCPEPIFARVRYRHDDQDTWTEVPLKEDETDHWRASFEVTQLGYYRYTVDAWTDPLLAWWLGLEQRANSELPLVGHAHEGLVLLDRALLYVSEQNACQIRECLESCGSERRLRALLDDKSTCSRIRQAFAACCDPDRVRTYNAELRLVVDPVVARFGAWYQVFPRSCSKTPAHHGSLRDLADRLPRIAELGFDIVYIPPIHPIGLTGRKGRNNCLVATAGDPGSPWAIGGREGGHKQIHPELGTVEDFVFLLSRAEDLGLSIALDIALQCSPDHPYVREHPEWFQHGSDGSIRCAEDPPNKYEDIYPFDFECPDWWGLWKELRSVFIFWVEQGVRVFRADNPHTKPFDFWEWLIEDLKRLDPSLIFLSEGLTRPSHMRHLARVGFTQSYDYFPWRNTKSEIVSYYSELNADDTRQFFRPVLWPNTPQFLSPVLQDGGSRALMARLILAGMLGASYGIYGPAYELCDVRAVSPGSTEYLDSEQYEIKSWDWNRQTELTHVVRLLNSIRRSNVALQSNSRLRFHRIDNEQLVAFSKTSKDQGNRILTIVSLGAQGSQNGWTDLSLEEIGLSQAAQYTAHDLLTGARYPWRGSRNYVNLESADIPAHILRLE
jgi:starch synthase (maltosyl-transferring)